MTGADHKSNPEPGEVSTQPPSSEPRVDVRRTAMGGLRMVLAKGVFLVASSSIQFVVPRVLGNKTRWGLLSAAMALISIAANTLIVSSVQTVSRAISSDRTGDVRASIRLFQILGVIVGTFLFLTSTIVARDYFNDELLTWPLRVGAIILVAYSGYGAGIGVLNGSQAFAKQSYFDMGTALGRATLMTLGALLGAALSWGRPGVEIAVVVGWSLVALTAWAVVNVVNRPTLKSWANHSQSSSGSARALLGFALPLLGYHLLVNGMLLLDVVLLKSSISERLMLEGQTASSAADLASSMTADYRVAQTYAMVPYQLTLALTAVLFPSVAAIVDPAERAKWVAGAYRIILVLLTVTVGPALFVPERMVTLLHQDVYRSAADCFVPLALGQSALVAFSLGATILVSLGYAKVVGAVALAAVSLLLFFVPWIASHVPVTQILSTTAWSVSAIFTLAAVGAFIWARYRVKFDVPFRTLAVCLVAIAVSGLSVRGIGAMSNARLVSFLALGAGALTALAVLWLGGERIKRRAL